MESDRKHSEVEIAKWTVHGFDLNSIVCAISVRYMQIAHMMNVEDTDDKVLNEMR